ncbi:MAG TPA: hypothetical protein VFU21_26900 [Kofleriaceae bacterium]|nr:hypothetical protein [Kofleriaceae bacterium]
MSGTSYAFLPWLRRGVGAHVDGGSSAAVRIDLGGGRAAQAVLPLAGPAEVVGLDARVVSRVWPVAGTGEAEPNLFPLVEFDQPDLPWRYTPIARAGERLLPWCVLIAVRDDELAAQLPAAGSRPLPAVSLARAQLPRLDQAWAWAHAQVTGGGPIDDAALAEIVRTRPNQVLSRLLCPRRLRARTRYHALLVPTFELGQRAGLGQSIEGVDPAALSWASGADAVDLPVYYRWSFATGEGGDFESLASRLGPARTTGGRSGVPIDAAQPGAGLPPAAAEPMVFEGALRPVQPPGSEPPAWPASERAAFVPALAALVNRPADLMMGEEAERAVAPPLYGQQHAGQDRLQGGEPPLWFQELNADPRLRAAAGLGAEVVRREQSELVAAAWAQVPGVSEVNDALRGAQLAREVLTSVHARHFGSAPGEQVIAVTAPVHARILASPTTVASRLRESPLAEGAAAGAFRRIARPLGALARKQPAGAGRLLGRLAAGELAAAPPPVAPEEMVTEERVGPVVRSPRRASLRELAPVELPERPASPRFVPVEEAVAGEPQPDPAASVAAFHLASRDLLAELEATVAPAPAAPAPVALAALSDAVVAALEPAAAMHAAFAHRLEVAGVLDWHPRDPLEPLLLGPEFERPMAPALAAVSARWILPGIGDLEPDRVTLVETNAPFVEAFLVGLNHEMGRELLWREFPTDARKTFFRRFWDSRGAAGGLGPPDIQPIHSWDPAAPLGHHAPAGAGEEELVLVVRGEVGHRYPRLLVTAVAARWNGGARELGTPELAPIFQGALSGDMAYYGFALTHARAIGSATAPGVGDPGWFFVISERPGEPKFGLDSEAAGEGPPDSWSSLAWTHLAGDPDAVGYIDLDAELPDTRGVVDPTGARWHADAGLGPTGARGSDLAAITLQQPYRVAFHASDLLPRRPHA